MSLSISFSQTRLFSLFLYFCIPSCSQCCFLSFCLFLSVSFLSRCLFFSRLLSSLLRVVFSFSLSLFFSFFFSLSLSPHSRFSSLSLSLCLFLSESFACTSCSLCPTPLLSHLSPPLFDPSSRLHTCFSSGS